MYRTLAIYDRDEEYSLHLTEYIKNKAPGLFLIQRFTREEALRESLKEEAADILLWGEEIPEEGFRLTGQKNLVILSDILIQGEKLPGPVIYKYQPGEIILKELKKLIPQEAINIGEQMGNADIITIFSLGCRKEQQGFALSLLRERSNRGKSIYFNLEAFPIAKELRAEDGEKGLSEFIYYLKQNPAILQKKFTEFIHTKGNITYVKGVDFGTDIFELTAEDMESWLQILSVTEYKTLIFNAEAFTPALLKLLQRSSTIYLLTEAGTFSEEQLNSFLLRLKWAGYVELAEKMVQIPMNEENQRIYEQSLLLGLEELP